MLGRALTQAGDKSGAQAEFLKAIELNPESGEASRELGLLYANSKQWEKAIPFLRTAEEHPSYGASRCGDDLGTAAREDDDRTSPGYLLALCLYKLERLAEADVILSRYRLPTTVPSLQLLLDVRRKMGKIEEFPEIYLEIGRLKSYREDMPGAAQAFGAAISYDQNRAASYNYLAGVQIAHNNIAEGEKNLEKALTLKPDYYGALIRKAYLY